MEEGLHRDMPEAVYRALPAASYSMLKRFERSAAHAREAMLHPKPSTPAQEFGRAVHLAILEPNRFGTEYAKAPHVDRRTKEGKASWLAFEAQHPNSQLLGDTDYAKCCAMRDAAWAHPLASALLSSQGHREVSAVWQNGETGVWCKARPDLLCRWDGRSVIVDVKTTQDASPMWFGRDAHRYHYDAQLAHYIDGINSISPLERGGIIIAIEKDAPFAIAVYSVAIEVVELGRRKVASWLKQYKDCTDSNVWPGYEVGLQNLEMPAWAWREEENE